MQLATENCYFFNWSIIFYKYIYTLQGGSDLYATGSQPLYTLCQADHSDFI